MDAVSVDGAPTSIVWPAILLGAETIISGPKWWAKGHLQAAMADRCISLAFGAVVRRHRTAKRLSQEALAEKADIHHTHVGLMERGERNPSLGVAHRVARALGLTLSAMIAQAERNRR